MNLKDISSDTFAMRLRSRVKRHGRSALQEQSVYDGIISEVNEEMLDEIHFMLRELLGLNKPQNVFTNLASEIALDKEPQLV